jgi:hypothetical protein
LFFRSGPKRAGVRKVPESKAAEEAVDSAVTSRKRRAESPGMTGHGEKKQKTGSTEPSGAKAEKAAKGSKSVASKEAKAADAKMKAAKDMEAAKEKAETKQGAKVITTGGAPRQGAKDGQELALT